jgi:hypothetical protein
MEGTSAPELGKTHDQLQSPVVGQVVGLRNETIDSYFYAILDGADMDYYASNSTECYERIINFVYYELPVFMIRLDYADHRDYMFNSTYLMRNVSNMAWTCVDAGENFYYFAKARNAEFTGFTDLMLGFFQNMLGNVIAFNTIYKNIVAAAEV